MPGVPSGRACDACRQQKKKCDLENFPCRRCRRLNIDCTGHGQQRFKFVPQHQTTGLDVAHRHASNSKSIRQEERSLILHPARNPSNGLTKLTSAFVHSLDQEVDIRFQLAWNFGFYLTDIPRRLGRSAALDAATNALVAAHSGFCAGDLASNPSVWGKYSQALTMLRHDLDDVTKARSSESLCAVMLLSVVQLLIDPGSGNLVGHTEGAATIMKSRGFVTPDDDFEKLLTLTLRGPVVFEALLTDKIRYSSHEWKLFNAQGPETQLHTEGQWFECIAVVPDLIQRCRAAVKLHEPPSLHLLSLELETRSLLDRCTSIITVLRERLEKYDPELMPAILRNNLHAHYLRSLGLAFGTGIILNCIIGGLEGTSDCVPEESSTWSEEIVQLSEKAKKYRPLGAMAMILCLRFACLGAAEAAAQERVKALLYDYELACIGITSVESKCGDLTHDFRRFTLQDT